MAFSAKVGASIRIEGPRSEFFSQTLPTFVKNMTALDGQVLSEIERIINEGVWKNFQTLSRGGAVPQAGGGLAVAWLQVRHPSTIVAREKMGLSPYEPFLDTRGGSGRNVGKLARGYQRGGSLVRRPGVGAQWKPGMEVERLMRVHEKGGMRIGRSKKFPGLNSIRIPSRPSIFWSREMAQKVLQVMARTGSQKSLRSPTNLPPLGPR